jgi:battenin
LQIVATSHSLLPRLCGIAIASFSSGLGEMTYLQKSTLYGSLSLPGRGQEDYGGTAVGWFSSGTGAAGIGGAGLWWVMRGLGVKQGLLICSVRD